MAERESSADAIDWDALLSKEVPTGPSSKHGLPCNKMAPVTSDCGAGFLVNNAVGIGRRATDADAPTDLRCPASRRAAHLAVCPPCFWRRSDAAPRG